MLDGARQYWAAVAALQQEIIDTQSVVLESVAEAMTACITNGRHIYLFGTGHSHMMAEEAHFRAGGLAACIPILISNLMLHESTALSSAVERTPGLAAPLLDRYQPQPGAMLFIFSNSGVNQIPVEIALEGKARGLTVVSVTSFAYSRIAPLSALGKRLDEVADFAIDTCVPPGDALIPVTGKSWKVGAASTIAATFVLNGLVAETANRLETRGIQAPVFVSFNMGGADDHNEAILRQWGGANPHI